MTKAEGNYKRRDRAKKWREKRKEGWIEEMGAREGR